MVKLVKNVKGQMVSKCSKSGWPKKLEVSHGWPPSFLPKFSSKIREFSELVLMAWCYSLVLHLGVTPKNRKMGIKKRLINQGVKLKVATLTGFEPVYRP